VAFFFGKMVGATGFEPPTNSITALEDEFRIEAGRLIEFEIIQGPKGPIAERVTRPNNYCAASIIRNIDDNRLEREVLLGGAPALVNSCATRPPVQSNLEAGKRLFSVLIAGVSCVSSHVKN
jgi:hypothetical protein